MERQELDGIARSEGGLVAVTKVISITQVNLIMISSKNYSDQDFMVKKWFQSLSLGGGRGCSDSYRVQRVFSSAQVLVAINHCHHLHPRHRQHLHLRHRQHLHPIRHPDHFCHVQFSADGGGSTAVGFVQCHLWGGTDQCEGGIIEVIIVIMIIMLIVVVVIIIVI